MPLLNSKKTFPFRQYAGREPSVEELRQEMELMYEYLIKQVDEALETVRGEIPRES